MSRDDQPLSLPVACTLTAADLASRREWLLPGLLAGAEAREAVAGGFRWRFSPGGELLKEAAAVIEAERRCCRFLRFLLTVEPDGGPVWLEVSGPAGTRDFLSTLLGASPSSPDSD